MKAPTIVAIDGPAGAGKSTVAKKVAAALGLPYVDTGAMYRAVGLLVRRAGIPLPMADPEEAAAVARQCRIDLVPDPAGLRVRANGEDVTEEVRSPEISLYASAVSAIPEIRRCLVEQQRRMGREGGGVLEGRDIGTRVFPETPHKFFLTASAGTRARRREAELRSRSAPQAYEAVLAELLRRDRDDSTRADSPLQCDASYRVIDTEELTPEEVARRIVAAVEAIPP